MNIQYESRWSSQLGQEMAFKRYGSQGKPLVVFPTQGGRFYEYEDFGMVEICSPFIESGKIQIFTPDGIDEQSWIHPSLHPHQKAQRHQQYDQYIVNELIPHLRYISGQETFLATGCSMGGYHSANFFFRYPAIFDQLISLSGVFRLKLFIGDYMDELVYYHTPLAYLANLEDPWYLEQYRKNDLIICVGQGAWEDDMLEDIGMLKPILEQKDIPHWIDYWGYDVEHDWPWWRKQMPYFLERLF